MRLLIVLALLLLTGCGASEAPYQTVTLPSGKKVAVLGIGQIGFSNDTPALMLKYQTDISLDDKASLENEVDEIWGSFRVDVEKALLVNGIVSANERPKGFIVTTSRARNFVFKRGGDGQWSKVGS
jgi:hypothetical protein